jgi:hypothetical protein
LLYFSKHVIYFRFILTFCFHFFSATFHIVIPRQSFIWYKQFESSLKPLDPKTNSINLIPNKIQGKSYMDNKSYKQISNKRLSGDDDMKSSRKKMKTESECYIINNRTGTRSYINNIRIQTC